MSEIGPVVDMSRSPYAKLRPVPLSAVKLTDTFWEPRRRINREITLLAQLKQCEDTGRVDNFRIASGRKQGEFTGIYFNDSDVYKWAEAAAYSIAVDPDAELEAKLDAVIEEIAAAQQSDGYLNTYFMFERAKDRYTNLKDMHELYCGGHLIQAAVAHFRATGKRTFLDVAIRLAENWHSHFGPGKRDAACGHEEAEMALVELYRATGETRWLELGKRMIDVRGQGETGLFGKSAYHQDHKPFVQQDEMIGHAVRHLYLCCGAADVLAEMGDADYKDALDALWENFTQCKMYVTGGAGARYEGEAFGENYELPNERAYAETCAAIGSVMWNWRMLNLTGESKYADLMERDSLQRRPARFIAGRPALLLRKPAGGQRQKTPSGMVRLRLLSAQRRPPARVPSRLFLQYARKRDSCPFVRLEHRDNHLAERRQSRPRTKNKLSLGRRNRNHD